MKSQDGPIPSAAISVSLERSWRLNVLVEEPGGFTRTVGQTQYRIFA